MAGNAAHTAVGPGLPGRLAGAVGRRVRRAWWTLGRRARPAAPAEAAAAWLSRAGARDGVLESPEDPAPCPHLTRACVDTALRCGLREEAERWRRWLRGPGRAAAAPYRPPRASAAVALEAAALYRSGEPAEADRLMRILEKHQLPSGGFPVRWGWLAGEDRRRESAWTAKFYLDGAVLRVRAAFEADWDALPRAIDPRDGRFLAVRAWCEGLAPEARVADVGCGRGRFLSLLAGEFPRMRLVGIDLVPAPLAELPQGASGLAASLLCLPLADGALDAAFAVESIEHALLPERAVAELCRVVRAGGRVLVIDKDRRKQPLSHHEPWERWFTPEELETWLARWCDEVRVTHVPHVEGRPARDLFLAACGVRKDSRSRIRKNSERLP